MTAAGVSPARNGTELGVSAVDATLELRSADCASSPSGTLSTPPLWEQTRGCPLPQPQRSPRCRVSSSWRFRVSITADDFTLSATTGAWLAASPTLGRRWSPLAGARGAGRARAAGRLGGPGLTGGCGVVPPYPAGDVVDLLAACVEHDVEGVMLKQLGSRYYPGERRRCWLKVKAPAWAPVHAQRRRPK
jgi:hypothetical protein